MFDSESVKILIALGTIAGVFLVMQFRRGTPTEILFCLALGIYVVSGVLTPERAWLEKGRVEVEVNLVKKKNGGE